MLARRSGVRQPWRLLGILAGAILLVLAASAAVEAALVGAGALPASGFTFVSTTQNSVNMAGDAIRLKIKDNVSVKTTYSIVAPSESLVGSWHYHNGPVIVTVTKGTLTFYGSDCQPWDVTADHTYIESAGEVLVARVLPSRNTESAEWFTTRLYPENAADPVPVAAPCTP